MIKGEYKTKNGSTLRIFGKYANSFDVTFDWLEEENACSDCEVNVAPEQDEKDLLLTWTCEICGGGYAKLKLITYKEQLSF